MFSLLNPDLSVYISLALYFILQSIRRPARHIPASVKQANLLKVVVGQGEVEEVDVLNHPFSMRSLWDDDNIVL